LEEADGQADGRVGALRALVLVGHVGEVGRCGGATEGGDTTSSPGTLRALVTLRLDCEPEV
jgi:hypothetical protein